MSKTVIVPEILSVEYPEKLKFLGYFGIGEILQKKIFPLGTEKVNFKINITSHPEKFLEDKYEQFSTYFKITQNDIFYEKKYLGLHCKMLIKNLNSDEITVYVNKTYLNVVKLRMDNLYPVGIHMMDIFLLNILKKGDLVIHGASLYNEKDKGSFLLIAPPDTGKTYSTAKLVEKGYKFLGEDLSYYSAEQDSLMCVPFTSTWGHHFSKSTFNISSWPIVGWFFTHKKEIVTDLFGENSLVAKGKLKRVYIIEKSDCNSLEKVELNDDFIHKVRVVQRNEFTYFKNMLLRAWEYVNGGNIDEIITKEDDSFKKLLSQKELYLVKGRTYSDFHVLIDENEQNFA